VKDVSRRRPDDVAQHETPHPGPREREPNADRSAQNHVGAHGDRAGPVVQCLSRERVVGAAEGLQEEVRSEDGNDGGELRLPEEPCGQRADRRGAQ
jgi:hypothetical protein